MPTLVGEFVTLRPYADADFDPLWEMLHDAEGADLTATSETFSEEKVRGWVRAIQGQGERLDLAIVESGTGEYAGEAVVNEFAADALSANFRISLRGPAWFGRGLGGEAADLLCAHALGTLGLTRLTLDVLARNPRAIRAYEKAGFVETGRFDEGGEAWVAMERLSPSGT